MATAYSTLPTVGVVGGSGYTGGEVLRRLAHHRGVRPRYALSRSAAGSATPVSGLAFESADADRVAEADLVFLCLPHGETAPWVAAAQAGGSRVIDLTADHRPGSGAESDAVYGLTEWNDVAKADLVANPGCYPTGVLTALKPLEAAGAISEGVVSIHAASGVSGAGRSPRADLLFGEVTGDFRAYGLGNGHRHLKEMRAALPGTELLFVPHLLPVERGILETITLPVAPGVDAATVRELWATRYAGSPVIRVLEEAPTLRQVARSDLLLLSAFDNAGLPGHLTLVVAFDNLGKGAAGQAIQNLNQMIGAPADEGLLCVPS